MSSGHPVPRLSIQMVLAVLLCSVLATACNTCRLCPPDRPPGIVDPSTPTWVHTQAATYGTGGMMISVDVQDPDTPEEIRVWAGAGGVPDPVVMPTGDPIIEFPQDLGFTEDRRWAVSTIVPTPDGTEQVYVLVAVRGEPVSETRWFHFTWTLAELAKGWQVAEKAP